MTILYESPWLLAIDKPAGLSVEQSPHHPSVEAWAAAYLAAQTSKPFLGIIHRLDRPVSGVLLLAKKKAALKHLNEQFARREVQKTYLALVENALPAPSGTLVHWLRKDLPHKKALVFNQSVKDAVECRLDYQFKERVGEYSLLEIQLHTGKFHQIRAQLAAIGCPILGDEKYGATTPYPHNTIALHAWQLTFRNPLNQKTLTVRSTLLLQP
jgi:23S rRNA pseudouridine1911/1915/1917 synthase